MKKLFALVLCVLLIGALAVTAFAANDTKITVTADKTVVKPGDTVNITVTMTGTDKFTSMGYVPYNDSPYFSIGKYTVNRATLEVPGNPAIVNFSKANGLAVGGYTDWDTEEDIAVSLDGVILTFAITVKADAPAGKFDITEMVSVNNGADAVNVALTDAELEIVCDHKYGDWTDNGDNHKQICEKCGDEKTANHAWDAGKVTTEPDCKNDGEKTFTCADCGATKTEPVKATGAHNYTNGVKADDTNHTLTCTGCGDTKTEAHKMDAGKITKEPTCKDEGVKTFSCTACDYTKTEAVAATGEHTYGEWVKDDAENHKKVCSGCGEAVTEAHAWDEGEITLVPTCKDAGEITYTCLVCEETKKEVIEPDESAHVSDNWTLVDENTHTGKCSVCNREVVVEHVFYYDFDCENHWCVCECGALTEKAAHELEWIFNEELHAHACECGYYTEEGEHVWDAGVVTVKPTTTTTGVKTHTCTTCGATKETEVPKTSNSVTGDNNMNAAFVVLAVLATCGLAVTVVAKKRTVR